MNVGHMNKNMKSSRQTDYIVASCFAILALVVFLPQGFSQLPTAETWFLANNAIHTNFTQILHVKPRMFLHFFWYVVMAVNDHSFVHINLLFPVLFFLRAWLFFFIVRRLWPGHTAVAFAAAAMFAYHPADIGYFWFCTVSIMMALVVALGCVALLLVYWQGGPTWLLAPMVALQTCVLWGYEGFIPALLVAPMTLYILPTQSNRKALPVLALWSVMPCMWFFYMTVAAGASGSRAHKLFVFDLPHVLEGLTFGYQWVLLQSWTKAAQITPSYLEFVLAGIAGIVVGSVSLRLARKQEEHDVNRRAWLAVIFVALVLLFLARIPFVLTPLYLAKGRAMFLAGASGALVTSAFCWLLSVRFGSYRPIVFSIMVGILVSFTVLHGIANRNRFTAVGTKRGIELARILEAAPRVKPNTVILVDLESDSQYRMFAEYPNILNGALKLLGGSPVGSSISPGPIGAEPQFDFGSDTVSVLTYKNSKRRSYPLRNLVVIGVTDDGESAVLDTIPSSLIGSNPSPPSYQPYQRIVSGSYYSRACTMLNGAALPSFCPQ
jgi:hypothetical protein